MAKAKKAEAPSPILRLIKTGQERIDAEKQEREDKGRREIAARQTRHLNALIKNCVNILGVSEDDIEVIPIPVGLYEQSLVKVDGWTFTNALGQYSVDPQMGYLCAVANCEACGKRLYSVPMRTVGTYRNGADLVLAEIDQAPPSKWGREYASTATNKEHECPNKVWVIVDTRSGADRELKSKIDDPVAALREALSSLGYAVTLRVKK